MLETEHSKGVRRVGNLAYIVDYGTEKVALEVSAGISCESRWDWKCMSLHTFDQWQYKKPQTSRSPHRL